jgi:hypothetical protein
MAVCSCVHRVPTYTREWLGAKSGMYEMLPHRLKNVKNTVRGATNMYKSTMRIAGNKVNGFL